MENENQSKGGTTLLLAVCSPVRCAAVRTWCVSLYNHSILLIANWQSLFLITTVIMQRTGKPKRHCYEQTQMGRWRGAGWH